MPLININTAEIYYELHGQGQPVILISGFLDDHEVWLPILESLSKEFQVLVFHNRGVGKTIDDGSPLTFDIMANDVMALAENLNLKMPHIVGHSMGGIIAQTVASLYPEKVTRLAILASSYKLRQAALLALKTIVSLNEAKVSFDIIFEHILSVAFGEKFLSDKNKIESLRKQILAKSNPPSLANQKRQFKLLEMFDGKEKLKSIKAKTLITYGSQDFFILPRQSEYMAENIPEARLKAFDCGHNLVLEETHGIAELLASFLLDKNR